MIRRLTILLASVSLTLFSSHGFAFEYGILRIPKSVETLRHDLLTRPLLCLEKIEHGLDAATQLSGDASFYSVKVQVATQQIAALCALRAGKPVLAEQYIDHSLELAKTHQAYLLQGNLIAALIAAQDPNQSTHAQEHLDVATEMAQSLKHYPLPNLQFQIQRLQGLRHMSMGQFNEAKNHLLRAKEEAYASQSAFFRARAEDLLGRLSVRNDQPELALSHFNEALNFIRSAQSDAEHLLLSEINEEIAAIYMQQQETDIAQQYQENAIEQAEALGSPQLLARQIATLADMASHTNQQNVAIAHLFVARDFANQARLWEISADIEHRLALNYQAINDYTAALLHFEVARELYQRQQQPDNELSVLLDLGLLHIANGEAGLAILQLERAEELANTMGLTPSHTRVFKTLAEAYEQNGNFDLALEHYKLFHQLSSQYQEIRAKYSDQQFKQHYQYIEQAHQLSELTQEKAALLQKTSFQQLILTLSAVLIVLLIMLYISSRQRSIAQGHRMRKLNHQLERNPATGYYQLHHCSDPLNMLKRYAQNSSLFEDPDNDYVLALLTIEAMEAEPQRVLGQAKRQELYKHLIEKILQPDNSNIAVGHLTHRTLLICAPKNERDCAQWFEYWQSQAELFAVENQLKVVLISGGCNMPFLTKARDAIDDIELVEVASLAQEAAKQLVIKSGQSEWLELNAMKDSPVAFFGKDIHQDVKQAISKGLVKISCSGDKSNISW